MRAKPAASLAALLALGLGGCGHAGGPRLLATVNGTPVTLRAWQVSVQAAAIVRGRPRPAPTRPDPHAIDQFLTQAAVMQWAQRHGWASSASVKQQADAYYRQHVVPLYGDRAGLKQALSAEHLSLADLRSYLVDQEWLRVALDRVAQHVPAPSRAEAARYYQQHRREFVTPAMMEVREIVVSSAEQARGIARQLQQGANFAALARRDSRDAKTSRLGGNLGWVAQGASSGYPAAWYQLADRLRPGQFGIAHIGSGYHIIEVEAIRPGQPVGFPQVASAVQAALKAQQQVAAFRKWAADIRRTARVHTFPQA
ncbi:MAG: peptidyl-prolyl cis-trans isomerase [Firmicutes bacterium]|nr:peptidyl-prolyl cis-trans isomerase [Bacillota bacterium]